MLVFFIAGTDGERREIMKKKRSMALLLAAVTALSTVACGQSGSTGKSVFRTLYSGEVSTLNYLTTSNTADLTISANIEDGLVEFDPYGTVTPCLAESWTSNDDKTEWTFKIRKGVKWVDKNGKAVADVTANDWVTAADYVNDAVNDCGMQYMYNTGAVVHGAQAYYDYTSYMVASDNGTKTTDEDGNALEPVAEAKVDDIGVKATDDYTLVYTLDQPCAFFPSVLSTSCYLPVNKDFLDKQGSNFGLDNDALLYCGAYVLSEYSPEETHVLKVNPLYWDKKNIHIDEIKSTYNAEATSVETNMYKNGEIDEATISSDLLDSWLKDDATKNQVHGTRPRNAYSYFYAFNFDPQFDAQYEPDNWKKAVNNENFRKAMMAALDRVKALTTMDPYNPESIECNTITPPAYCAADGVDFTEYDALKKYTDGDSFDADAAVKYRDAAKKELEAAGCTFPIKVLMPYNPSVSNWDKECQVVEQQMEGVLGTDFIDIIVQAGPDTGFLSAIRRSGKYAFMKCNWDADYADPQTWTTQFDGDANKKYIFWDKSEDPTTAALYKEWKSDIDQAAAITDDQKARYTKFAEAEALMIDHAVVVPFSISFNGYVVSKLNPLEGEYAPYGLALLKYKYMTLHDTSMNMDEFNKALEEWKAARTKAVAAGAD